MPDRDGRGPRARSPRPSRKLGGKGLGKCKPTRKAGKGGRK